MPIPMQIVLTIMITTIKKNNREDDDDDYINNKSGTKNNVSTSSFHNPSSAFDNNANWLNDDSNDNNNDSQRNNDNEQINKNQGATFHNIYGNTDNEKAPTMFNNVYSHTNHYTNVDDHENDDNNDNNNDGNSNDVGLVKQKSGKSINAPKSKNGSYAAMDEQKRCCPCTTCDKVYYAILISAILLIGVGILCLVHPDSTSMTCNFRDTLIILVVGGLTTVLLLWFRCCRGNCCKD